MLSILSCASWPSVCLWRYVYLGLPNRKGISGHRTGKGQFSFQFQRKLKVAQLCPTLCDPMDHTIHGILQARILECVHFPFPGDLPNLEIEPRSPTLQVDSLPAEPQWKPKNTGVGRWSLLQHIFLTQELNWGLLHFRWILFQLSYEESPIPKKGNVKECSNYHAITLISHASKVLLKIL